MAYGKRSYNSYRKRYYNISDTKKREYAKEMEELEQAFEKLSEWELSSMKDSCYKRFDNFEMRLSNHSANNQYHDLENGLLLVNIKGSKRNFPSMIENIVPKVMELLENLDLEKYRFINIVDNKANCFVKGFKTKKEIFTY